MQTHVGGDDRRSRMRFAKENVASRKVVHDLASGGIAPQGEVAA